VSLSVIAAAADSPDRVALVTGDRTFTFAELADRVRRVVDGLRSRGLAGEAPVGLVAHNDLPTLEVVHALLALGTPVLLLHPRLTDAERDAVVAAVAPAGVVDPARSGRGDPVPADAPWEPDPAPPPDDERPLAIVQTSGTSGRPKGVVLSRRAFAASARASAANLGWQDDDRWLLPLPVAHVGGLSIVTRCLLARRAVVLAPGMEPRPLMDSVERHRVTLLSLVPTVLKRILDLDPPAPPPDYLRAVLLGGAAAYTALLERAADHGWPVLTTYGLSEACSQVTTQPYGTPQRGELGSGPPLPGTEIRIDDDDAILVRGPTLLSRYLITDDSGATRAVDPLTTGGWLATGDHGRLDQAGNLHILGRRGDRIISGGENVDPVEVEHALERLPGVRQACVFGIPDEEWGEVVCAAVVAGEAAGGEAGAEALADRIAGLREVLAPFKVPRRIAVLDALPLNATGKVDRAETARQAAPLLRPVRG